MNTPPGDRGSFFIFGQQGQEAVGFATRLVDPFNSIAFGFLQGSLGFTTGSRNFAVELLTRLKNETLLLLLRLVDLVECVLDRIGRGDILELDGNDPHADVILIQGCLQVLLNFSSQRGTCRGENLGDVGVADCFADHRLTNVTDGSDRILDPENILEWVNDLELDDPFDVTDIEVTGQG